MPTIQYAYSAYSNQTIGDAVLCASFKLCMIYICVRSDISATFSHTFATIEDSVVVFLP